jgi:hypothetical protein
MRSDFVVPLRIRRKSLPYKKIKRDISLNKKFFSEQKQSKKK